jgi:hypothetical protein
MYDYRCVVIFTPLDLYQEDWCTFHVLSIIFAAIVLTDPIRVVDRSIVPHALSYNRNYTIMRPLSLDPQVLRRYLLRHKTATLAELRAALGTTAHGSVFRKLKLLGYLSITAAATTLSGKSSDSTMRACGTAARSGSPATVRSSPPLSPSSFRRRAAGSPTNWLTRSIPRSKIPSAIWSARDDYAGRRLVDASCTLSPESQQDQIRRRLTARSVPLPADTSVVQVSPDELKAATLLFYGLLEEQQRRLFAGLESIKQGHGGDTIMAEFLGLEPQTVARGRRQLLDQKVTLGRTRRSGGGRKPAERA